MWNKVFEVYGEFSDHGAFGTGQPLEKPEADGLLPFPSDGRAGIRVRKEDSVVPVAALIVTGITEEGQREKLGLTPGGSL